MKKHPKARRRSLFFNAFFFFFRISHVLRTATSTSTHGAAKREHSHHTTHLVLQLRWIMVVYHCKTLPRYSSNPTANAPNPFQHRHTVTKGEQCSGLAKNPRNSTHVHARTHQLRVEEKGRIKREPSAKRATPPCLLNGLH